jgi:WD40 repeat protein
VNLDSPYKGLDAFGDSNLDALLFFGREREREIVVANLIASRLTLLYGPTGVGKSSLLRAGVARALRDLPEGPIVVVFDRWGDDPVADLAAAVAEASGESPGDDLLDVVERAQRSRDVYLILDQAEEYFVYYDEEAEFDAALARLVGDPLRVNVLLSLREDSLAKLDRFKPRIPAVYANSLRLDRLDREAGRAAIVRPVERWNELRDERLVVEPALVAAVLDGVRAGRIELGAGGLGAVEGNGRPPSVEAPYLQLVMQRLWEVERNASSTALRAQTLDELGGARQVVADHLERAVGGLTPEQRDVAGRLFTYLVTPSGTKIAHELRDLSEYAGVSQEEAAPVVETLSRHRILRPDEAGRTEIFHDVLAGEVLAWRRRHAAESALEQERAESHRRHRRLTWLAGGAIFGFALMTLLTVFALSQRSEARAQAREARAHELEAQADAELARDPELSLLLALEAAKLVPGQSAEHALRDALLASRVRSVVDVGERLLSAAALGNGVVTANESGDVISTNGRTGSNLRTIATGTPATDASFADDATALLTGRDGQVRVVQPDGGIAAIPGVSRAHGAALSPDASLAAVIDVEGVRLVDVGTGAVREAYPHRGAASAAISSDNRRVVTGGVDGNVHVWSGQSGRRVHSLTEHEGHAVAVAFSRDGSLVASASSDNVGRMWRSANWGLTGVLLGHTNQLTDVAFSSDGEHVVTASRDATARVFKADTGAPLFALVGNKDWVNSAEFSGAAGSRVVTASADGTARMWDALFQPELEALARFPASVTYVETADGGQIRATTSDGQEHVLDSATGKELGVEPGSPRPRRVIGRGGTAATIRGKTVILRGDGRKTVLRGHRDRVTSVSFSQDGSLLATASIDHDVRIWDGATGASVGSPLQHNTAVHDARFSPDGKWLISAANRAGLWDVRNGTLVRRLQGHEGTLTSATFGPTGATVVTGGIDGTVRTYTCEICGGIDDLVKLARKRLAATGRELTPDERERYLG